MVFRSGVRVGGRCSARAMGQHMKRCGRPRTNFFARYTAGELGRTRYGTDETRWRLVL
jgi:hypothetical protein